MILGKKPIDTIIPFFHYPIKIMEFKTTAVLKYPQKIVWWAMRDHLPEIAEMQQEIQSVQEQEREHPAPGQTRVVSIWRAAPDLPGFLMQYVKPEMLQWTDTAVWKDELWECHWEISPHYLSEYIDCKGITKFEPAMGGLGTRVTFSGTLGIAQNKVVTGMLLQGVENIVGKVIPNNFNKMMKTLGEHLAKGK